MGRYETCECQKWPLLSAQANSGCIFPFVFLLIPACSYLDPCQSPVQEFFPQLCHLRTNLSFFPQVFMVLCVPIKLSHDMSANFLYLTYPHPPFLNRFMEVQLAYNKGAYICSGQHCVCQPPGPYHLQSMDLHCGCLVSTFCPVLAPHFPG